MNKRPGIVLLTTKSHIGSVIFLNKLVESGINVLAVVESQTLMSRDNNFGNYLRQIKIMGLSQTAQRLLFSLGLDLSAAASVICSYFGRPQKLLTPGQISRRYRIPIIKTKDINSSETIGKIKAFEPDILVSSCFNQILKKEVIELPKISCVNVHLALAQEYRGLNSYYWVLANNERKTGATLHEVDLGIDTGKVIAQRSVNIEDSDTGMGLFIKISRLGAELFVDSLDMIGKGRFLDINNGSSKYYSTFTKDGYNDLVKSGRKFFTTGDIPGLF